MKHFSIFLEDKPGELARLCSVISHINLKSIAAEPGKRHGYTMVKLVTQDEESTKHALNKAEFEFSEQDILVARLIDQPGELAKLARLFGDANLNINDIYLLDKATLALTVNQSSIGKARELLGNRFTERL